MMDIMAFKEIIAVHSYRGRFDILRRMIIRAAWQPMLRRRAMTSHDHLKTGHADLDFFAVPLGDCSWLSAVRKVAVGYEPLCS